MDQDTTNEQGSGSYVRTEDSGTDQYQGSARTNGMMTLTTGGSGDNDGSGNSGNDVSVNFLEGDYEGEMDKDP